MTDRDSARAEIAALVENFRNLSEADKRRYTEEEVKKDFLLPMFRALGWDVENSHRRNEVRAEEKIGDGYPDYSFRLNGVPIFFLEAKKFSVDIAASKPMQQAINYSYLKGVTWAVLSDFEGLMVFNADWEERDPIKARMLDLHWQNYTEGDFDLLWLLSKPSIEAGEIDQKAEQFGRKKKRDDVNKVLFADLTQWRRKLFAEITQMGQGTLFQSTDFAQVDEAIQRILDRLIFIRTVEDRKIEENRLRAALRQYEDSRRKGKNLFADIKTLFREMDDIYNARLFARAWLDEYVELHDVNLLTDIINGLYDVKGNFATYDFAAIDADVLGAVYEQYLSFKAQDPQGKQEIDLSKRSKRKAQGIYYTPKYVVRYIVAQTLGKLLESPDMTAEKAHRLRILDPACGSGSFLIEAFQVLDRWLAEHGDDKDRSFPRQRQMRILQENIYGVDLDPQAVEVARLNLLLQAAHERGKLPMLHHIKYGNSLIDDPDIAGEAAFRWEDKFPEVMAGDTQPLWFVTFVTHNSRVSERMVTYGVETGNPLIFSPEEQLIMAQIIAEACQKYHVPVVAWNILPDHVHLVIGAKDEAALTESVRKIKGYSSHQFKRRRSDSDSGLGSSDSGLGSSDSGLGSSDSGFGSSDSGLKPTVSAAEVDSTPVWARKFNRQPITNETALDAIIQYVRENHQKHSERWGDDLINLWQHGLPDRGLQPLAETIASICIPPEEAAHIPGGFDVVVGNPPYVRQETLGAQFKDYASQTYQTYAGTADLYVYFIEKAISLLKDGGQFGYIVPNKWMRAGYGKALRQWLKTQNIQQIIDFGDLPVFEEATTYPCIITISSGAINNGLGSDSGLKPTAISDTFTAAQVESLDFISLDEYASKNHYTVNRDTLDDAGWSLVDERSQRLADKLMGIGLPLGKYIENKIYYGIKTGLNEAFVIDDTTRRQLIQQDPRSATLIKPFLAGREIKRYEKPIGKNYVIIMPSGWTNQNTNGLSNSGLNSGLKPTVSQPLTTSTDSVSEKWNWLKDNYPAIAQHLEPYAEKAEKRWDKGEYWWELRPCDYYDKFEEPKIIFPDISARGNFTLDLDGTAYSTNTTYFIPSHDKYLVGLLNSKLFTFIYASTFSVYRGGYYRFFTQSVEKLPIRTINFDDPADKQRHDNMVAMVERMLALKAEEAALEDWDERRHDLAQQIARLDGEIDALVYALYGLTDEEIAIVEG